jgi:hypothetical protein
MKMQEMENNKWYPVYGGEHIAMWMILDKPDKMTGKDILDDTNVGKEQAEYNAILCSQAPMWMEYTQQLMEIVRSYVSPMSIYDKDIEMIDKIEIAISKYGNK